MVIFLGDFFLLQKRKKKKKEKRKEKRKRLGKEEREERGDPRPVRGGGVPAMYHRFSQHRLNTPRNEKWFEGETESGGQAQA